MKQTYLEAGQIVNTHGVRGEVKVQPWADGPEFLLSFDTVYLDGAPCRVEEARPQKTMVLLKLAGVDSVEAAAARRGKTVSVLRGDARLEPGRVFVADLLGLPVFDGEREIGVLKDVLSLPAGDVYVVQGEREYLVPAVPAFVEKADPDAGRIVVHLIEGMASDAL